MFLVVGVLAALWERRSSGRGQVVDAAIIDGSSLLNTFMYGMLEEGTWLPERGSNVSDSGSPFYDVYATADGQYMAVGAIEPKFWSELVHALALPSEWLGWQGDRGRWAEMKATMRDLFRTRTRAEWTAELVDLEACVSPVMAPAEAPADPQVAGRHGFVTVDGILQPAPAPRFDRTPGVVAGAPPEPGAHSTEVLSEAGFSDVEVKGLIASGAVRPAC
jgi:alpha-methylacyl-CoA racemase